MAAPAAAERGPAGEADRRGRAKVVALAHVPVVVAVRGHLRVDPSLAVRCPAPVPSPRSTGSARPPDRSGCSSSAASCTGASPGDSPSDGVAMSSRASHLRRPRVRVARRHLRRARPQAGDPRAVLLERRPFGRPQRVLEQRVHDDRRDQVRLRPRRRWRGSGPTPAPGSRPRRPPAAAHGSSRRSFIAAATVASASAPHTTPASSSPAPMRLAMSLTSTCGPSPPMFVRSVSAGAIPRRAATSAAGSAARTRGDVDDAERLDTPQERVAPAGVAPGRGDDLGAHVDRVRGAAVAPRGLRDADDHRVS